MGYRAKRIPNGASTSSTALNACATVALHVSGIVALALVVAGCDRQAQSGGAHVHGMASLTISMEDDRTGHLQLESPAESIYGFEHEPTTEEEEGVQADAIAQLEQDAAALFVFPAAAGCTISVRSVEVTSASEHADEDEDGEDHEGETADEHADEDEAEHDAEASNGMGEVRENEHEGAEDDERGDEDEHADDLAAEHREVHAAYAFTCAESLDDASLGIEVGSAFPGIQQLDVVMILPDGQSAEQLEGGVGSVDL